MQALIIYEQSDRWWSGIFKRNFSHVKIAVFNGNDTALLLDSKSTGVALTITAGVTLDVYETALRDAQIAVQRVSIPELEYKVMPVGFFTCVEFVKRVLGIRSVWVQSPYQLFNYVQRRMK